MRVITRPLPAKRAREYPLRTKLLAWACLTSVQIFASSVLKLSNSAGRYAYSPQSSLVLSETIKILLSLLYLARSHPSLPSARAALRDEVSPRLVAHMAGLALLYCANNALMFLLFARADPGSITLIKSGATIVSALLMYAWRRFTLSPTRWLVLLVQLCGLVVAQLDACAGKPHLAAPTYAVLVVSLLNSSVANVWNEHVVKQFDGASLATKNVLLYSFGAAFNMVGFLRNRTADAHSPAFFEGYGAAAVLVVVSNAWMGIAINIVYKYADAVVKNLATTTTTAVLLVMSAMWFGGRGGGMVFVGAFVVMAGTYLYFAIGRMEKEMQDGRELRRVAPS